MNFAGKLAGAFFGYLLTGGSILGALLGLFVGHLFDKGLSQGDFSSVFNTVRNRAEIQQVFFKTIFSLMGHISKSDGHVSPDEIEAARAVMQQMRLDDEQKQTAIGFFTEGKQSEFNANNCIEEFAAITNRNRALSQMLMEVLIFSALADGKLDPAEEKVLFNIGSHIGYTSQDCHRLIQMVLGQQHFHQGAGFGTGSGAGQGAGGQTYYQQQSPEEALKEAYAVLGVSSDVSDAELKKAYRRQMNQHHPDKLVSRGMPEEMVKMATEKTQEIKSAYELVKQSRTA